MRVIISAAGTGGHINPGIAIANKIREKEPDSKIIFIGTNRGLENDLVPRAGYELKTIEAYGLKKEISFTNLKHIFQTISSRKEVKKIIDEFKPDVVLGTGGYICGPVMSSAISKNIPTVLHESNAYPGKAVKMFAREVDLVLAGFEEAKTRLIDSKKVIVTGTPTKIRKLEISNIKKKELLKEIGIKNDLPIVLVFGGSQGAKRINDAIIKLIENNLNKNYQMIWATGPKQYDIIKEELQKNNIDVNNITKIKVLPYIYNMEEIMNVVDVIVSRSGAMTITEISNLGKPSILVPLPNVSHNHQLYNAKVLENIDAAKIILDDEMEENKLNASIEEIILHKNKIKEMGENALKVSTNDSEEKIYKEIKKLVK